MGKDREINRRAERTVKPLNKYLKRWLDDTLETQEYINNLARLHCPELIKELTELKEQKNGNFKEKIKPTQE